MKGVVNGFQVRSFTRNDQKGIFVVYTVDRKPFTSSKYYPVNEETIKKVKEKLEDYTTTNQQVDELCQTIPLVTMIYFVEKIIFNS